MDRKTNTEWFSLLGIGGNYGGGGCISFVTLRWKYVYWEIFRGCGGAADFDHFRTFGVGGTSLGFPWFVDRKNRHEIRFGLGLEGGLFYKTEPNNKTNTAGFLLAPELSYVIHLAKYLALQVGVTMRIGFYSMDDKGLGDPFAAGFAGFRI